LRGRKINDEYEFFGSPVLKTKLGREYANVIAKRIGNELKKARNYGGFGEVKFFTVPTFLFVDDRLLETLDEIIGNFGLKKPFDELYKLQKTLLKPPEGVV
jgi:hypothetical protein